MTFLTGDADTDKDGVIQPDEAAAAAEAAGENAAELMGAGDNEPIEAQVTEEVFDSLSSDAEGAAEEAEAEAEKVE
jgi:hypothetical protein